MKAIHAVLISAVIAGAGTAISAQSPGWTPVLEFRAVAAAADGDKTVTSNSWPLVVNGQPVTTTTIASSTLCSTGGGTDEFARRSPNADTIWKFSATLEGVDGSGYRLRVTSQFDRYAAGATPAPWTQPLVLKEGEEVTIDTIRAASDGPCHIRNLTMRARVVLRATNPAAQAARYTADAWLVHTDPAGTERRQHVTLSLDGSGPVPFTFEPIGFALPQLNPHQGDLQAFLALSGILRARTRPDGGIDVDVDTVRPLGLFRPSEGNGKFRAGAGGHKTLTLKDDETVAIDLPAPASGYSTMALTPEAKFNVGAGVRATGPGTAAAPASTTAVTVKGDVLTLNTALFFKDHKTQLLIRLRKARD